MSTPYTVPMPSEFSGLLQRFRLDYLAQAEIENYIADGIRRLSDVGVVPWQAVYRGAVDDLRTFLEQAELDALLNGKSEIDLDSLRAIQLRIPHIWPFF